MKNNSYTLTDKELKKIIKNICDPICKLINKLIGKELSKLEKEKKNININSYINLSILSLATIDVSVLLMMRVAIKDVLKKEINFSPIVVQYFNNISAMLNEEESRLFKEKMN